MSISLSFYIDGISIISSHVIFLIGVEKLKSSFPSGDSLMKAPLLACTLATLSVEVSLDGIHGAFYSRDNVLQVVRTRQKEEMNNWNYDADVVNESWGGVEQEMFNIISPQPRYGYRHVT